MTQSTESMIEVMQAYKDGKKIEIKDSTKAEWRTCLSPLFNLSSCEYRIAPEPKKKVKYLCFDIGGILTWEIDRGTHFDDWIRVPSEDKEIEI